MEVGIDESNAMLKWNLDSYINKSYVRETIHTIVLSSDIRLLKNHKISQLHHVYKRY